MLRLALSGPGQFAIIDGAMNPELKASSTEKSEVCLCEFNRKWIHAARPHKNTRRSTREWTKLKKYNGWK